MARKDYMLGVPKVPQLECYACSASFKERGVNVFCKPGYLLLECLQALTAYNWPSAGSNHQSLIDQVGRPHMTFYLERARSGRAGPANP